MARGRRKIGLTRSDINGLGILGALRIVLLLLLKDIYSMELSRLGVHYLVLCNECDTARTDEYLQICPVQNPLCTPKLNAPNSTSS